MDNTVSDGVTSLMVEEKQTTAIIDSTAVVEDTALTNTSRDLFYEASTSIKSDSMKTLEDRWMLLANGEWNSDQETNTILQTFSLPYDYVIKNVNAPVCAMFYQHRLWKGDMRIKMVLNSSQFNVGQLCVSWYYADKYDNYAQYRRNFYCGVQLANVLINANTSNDTELFIPFKSFKSMVSTMHRYDESDPLSVGCLNVSVAAPLRVSTTGCKSVDYSLFICFENCEYVGLTSRSMILRSYPQMMGIKKIVNTASDVLDVIYDDPNRDKPPSVLSVKQVVPMSSGNWASGINDIDQLYALRLDPAAQTPHPPGSLFDVDETLINVIKVKRGFLSQIRWSRNDDVGKILGEFGACPDKPCAFPIVAISDPPNVREAYIVPPVSVLTSFNCYWRGDLELEFDLIASVSHKGSIMVTYLPGAIYADVANTQADFNSGHNAVFKLDGKTSFVFRVPFISDKPWWSVGETFGDEKRVQLPPGIIYVTVVNRLCIMNAVSDEININVYLKGADNFEVAIPTPPSYIPFWNGASVPLTQRGLFQKPGYDSQIAFGNWRYASAGVLRYSTVADHITQWDGRSHPFGIYEIDPINSPRLSLNGKVVNNRGVTMTVRLNYFVRFICNGDRDSYFYMTAFQTLNQAQTYVNKWRVLGNDDPLSNSPQMYMLKGVEEPDYVEGKIILRFIGFSCEPQMDSAYISFSNAATTTNNGRIQFGESFVDVIDYMRRYQPYCNFTAITTSYMSEDVFQLQYKIPIFPIGLDIAESVDFSKVTKGGVIPLLLSAYRFYRGALRFRIVVNCKDDIKMFVQHRMDQIPSSRKMVQGTHKSDYYQTLESGYAQSYCFTKINPVTTIEVPFYNNGVLALLQNPNFKSISEIQHYSLGFLSFAFFSSAKVSFNVQLYYSIADDFKPSNFIGFGPLSSITNILPKETLDEKESFERLCAEQEFFQQREVMASDSEDSYMESPARSYVSDSHPKTVSQVVSGQNTFVRTWLHGDERPIGHDVDVIHAEPNGLFDKIFSKTAKDVVDAKFAELKEDPSDLYNMINEFLKPYFEKLIDVGSDVKGRISTIVSNLVHALISRTWPSVCFAMIAILECLGLIRTKFVAMLGNLFTKLLSYCEKISSFASKFFSEDVQLSSTPEFDVVEHNSKKGEDFDHKDLVSGFSTILSIVVNSADLVYRRVSTGSFFF